MTYVASLKIIEYAKRSLEVCTCVCMAWQGLHHLHSNHRLHQDIKPGTRLHHITEPNAHTFKGQAMCFLLHLQTHQRPRTHPTTIKNEDWPASAVDVYVSTYVYVRITANILLTGKGFAKLADFGLATALDASQDPLRHKATVGNVRYTPPECWGDASTCIRRYRGYTY